MSGPSDEGNQPRENSTQVEWEEQHCIYIKTVKQTYQFIEVFDLDWDLNNTPECRQTKTQEKKTATNYKKSVAKQSEHGILNTI